MGISRIKTRNKTVLSLATCLVLASACTPTIEQRGNMLQDFQLEEVVIGIHTQSDVLRLLGSPTTQAPFDKNVWYYIGQETEKRGILDPEIMEERIVVVTFNEKGIVQSAKDMEDGRINVPFERSKTATHGSDLTIIQQLLGNLGKFNPQEGAQ